MESLKNLPIENIRSVFADLDDTLTDQSKILSETYESLWRLHNAGKRLVIVSGRPAGWAECLMRLWPIDAMIFENGAGIVTRDGNKLKVNNLAKDINLDEQKAKLQDIFNRLKQSHPSLKLASDQPYRLFDYAIDYNEQSPFLPENEVNSLLSELSKEQGITVKLSSIHINYWCGDHTKVTACEYLLKEMGSRWNLEKANIVFCGDSPNDEPLFQYFDQSVGVANIKKFLPKMKAKPRYVTEESGGRGFQELVLRLM